MQSVTRLRVKRVWAHLGRFHTKHLYFGVRVKQKRPKLHSSGSPPIIRPGLESLARATVYLIDWRK